MDNQTKRKVFKEYIQATDPDIFKYYRNCRYKNLEECCDIAYSLSGYEKPTENHIDWLLFKVHQTTEKVTVPLKKPKSKDILASTSWKVLRYRVLLYYGSKCMCCGTSPKYGAVMHVDHIKPKSKYPELAFEFDNLQVLCSNCNIGKQNIDETDWR